MVNHSIFPESHIDNPSSFICIQYFSNTRRRAIWIMKYSPYTSLSTPGKSSCFVFHRYFFSTSVSPISRKLLSNINIHTCLMQSNLILEVISPSLNIWAISLIFFFIDASVMFIYRAISAVHTLLSWLDLELEGTNSRSEDVHSLQRICSTMIWCRAMIHWGQSFTRTISSNGICVSKSWFWSLSRVPIQIIIDWLAWYTYPKYLSTIEPFELSRVSPRALLSHA